MAGRFFGWTTGYTKEGKGVHADEVMNKRAFFRFFDILKRKLLPIITFNLLYIIALLPLMILLVHAFAILVNAATLGTIDPEIIQYNATFIPLPMLLLPYIFNWPFFVILAMIGYSFLLFGPITCGLTYVCRNIAREEHAWTNDFFSRAWSNRKKGLIIGIIDLILLSIIAFNVFVSPHLVASPYNNIDFGIGMVISRWVTVIIGLNYFIMRPFIYLQTVTFDIGIRKMFKNAWILSGASILRSGIFTVVVFGTFFIFWAHPFLESAIFLFAFSFWTLLGAFLAWPVILEHMVEDDDPMRTQLERKKEVFEDSDEVF